MCVETRNVPLTLHTEPCTFTTSDQEDAYYRAHTLTAPRWLTATAALVRKVGHGDTSAHIPLFQRFQHR
ncbi:MAG: hypothetical protein FD150_1493 [Rhodobacteraceae bacterium]|nr:MAG: hypothetical protein FD150_1493 [Paracoccaceae bacterium]